MRTRALVLAIASPHILCALPRHLDGMLQEMFDAMPDGEAAERGPTVVICHTLSAQHGMLCRKIHAIAPHARIIMLKETEKTQRPDDDRCIALPSGTKPAVLLQSVQQAMQS